jgi:SAM-dependent methyltransferase
MDSRETYKRFARFYDIYVQGFGEDIKLYMDFCDTENSILEIGCGTGRVLRPLLETGHAVTGVDISDAMLEISSQKLDSYIQNGRLKLANHNFSSEPLPKQFERVMITFYTFNYILENQVDFLRNVRESMKPGGKLIIDFFYPVSFTSPDTDNVWREGKVFFLDGKKVLLKDKRRMDGHLEERVQVFTWDGASEEIVTLRRFFDKDEAAGFLEEAGFVNINVTDGYNAACFHKPSKGESATSGFVILAQKPQGV